MIAEPIVAGIDVSKDRLDVHVLPGSDVLGVDHSPRGLARLAAYLRRLGVERIGLEASGGYERQALNTLAEAGFEVCLVPPARVRALARALGRHAKTDPIDAWISRAMCSSRLASMTISPIRPASAWTNWPACAANWWLNATSLSPGSTSPRTNWCAPC